MPQHAARAAGVALAGGAIILLIGSLALPWIVVDGSNATAYPAKWCDFDRNCTEWISLPVDEDTCNFRHSMRVVLGMMIFLCLAKGCIISVFTLVLNEYKDRLDDVPDVTVRPPVAVYRTVFIPKEQACCVVEPWTMQKLRLVSAFEAVAVVSFACTSAAIYTSAAAGHAPCGAWTQGRGRILAVVCMILELSPIAGMLLRVSSLKRLSP